MAGIRDHLDTLMRPAAWPVPVREIQRVETHISWVFLTGDYAWKIKKPVDLGFLDFSTLEKRRFFCEEELRLNRRLAPQLYCAVDAVCLSDGQLQVGECDEPVDYAVRMRQFDPAQQLDRVLARGELRAAHMEQLARHVARFHGEVAVAGADTSWGDAEQVVAPMLANFAHIREAGIDAERNAQLDRLEAWTREAAAGLHDTLVQRKAAGFVRECHGDLHLANMALLDGEVIAFDCLEFNPALRWIDIISEVAFTVMDLEDRGAPALAGRFLDTWLAATGDYAGVRVLDFYKVYRAMVRAKVNAIRLKQQPQDEQARHDVHTYLDLAETYTQPASPVLVLTHGLSAAGKSTLATALLEAGHVIRLRSDVERKRLFGLAPEAASGSGIESGIYSREASLRTYTRLNELAEQLVQAGYSVILDAAFLQRARREAACALAQRCGVPCVLLEVSAPEQVLRERIRRREGDVSEADLAVLEKQIASVEPVTEDEVAATGCRSVRVDIRAPIDGRALARELGLAQVEERGARNAG